MENLILKLVVIFKQSLCNSGASRQRALLMPQNHINCTEIIFKPYVQI